MDFNGLTQQAAAINSSIQTYDSLITRMRNASAQIGASWEGEAGQAFTELMGKYIREAGKMTDVLETIKKYASDVSADFEELDRNCASRIRNSF